MQNQVQNVSEVNEGGKKPGKEDVAVIEVPQDKPSYEMPSFDRLSSSNSTICRICHMGEPRQELINPCNCRGTLGYVHRRCLESWLSRSGLKQCELCLYVYKTKSVLRYTFMQSLRIFFSHPNNRGLLQADLLAMILITMLTVREVYLKACDPFLTTPHFRECYFQCVS